MALREVATHIRFAGGVETKEDPKAAPAAKLLVLENGVFDRVSTIKKRNGYERLGDTIDGSASLVIGAIRTSARGDELLRFTANRCYSHQTGTDQWSDAGPVFSAVGSDRPLVRTGTQQTAPDHATLDDVTVSAWEDSQGGVWWSTSDASGRVLKSPAQADAIGVSPRCVAVGSNLHVYYALATGRIMVLVVNPAAPSAVVAPVLLTDDLSTTNSVYDACPTGRAAGASAIVWAETGSTNIRIGYVDQSGVLGSPLSGHPAVLTYVAARNAATPLSLAFVDNGGADNDRFAVSWWSGATDGRVATFNGGQVGFTSIRVNIVSTVVAVTSPQRIATAAYAGVIEPIVITAWEEAAVAASKRFTVTTTFDSATAASSTLATIRSVGLASGAFVIDSEAFAVFLHDTTYFNTYVTLRLSDATCVGRHVPASAGAAPTRRHLPSAHVADSVARIALPVRERLASENNDKFRETGIGLFTLDFDNAASHQTARLGAGLYMAGACPQHYDGRVWTEQGFHFGPELIATALAAGGSMTPSTTYEYRCWYESTDAQGEVHLGPTSIGTIVTMGGADTQVTLTLPMLRVTQKTNVRIGVARSLAAKTGDGARLFRVTSLDPSTAGTANGYVASSTSSDTATFIDRMSDATLQTFDEIYTDGGILSNDPSSIGSVLAGGKSRLIATDSSDGNVIRFSQPIDPGHGVEWPPDLAFQVDPVGGDITALAVRDDRAFIFKANAILTFVGDGPAPNGDSATSGFTTPQLLPGDVGCTNPASIVLTPGGFMFQSSKGIYLLGNDGALAYIGAAVEAYNNQTISRATVMPDRTQVVFLADSGLTLLYDTERGQWSTFTNHEGLDAVVVSNTYHYLRTDGTVYRETVGAYSDAGVRIRLRLETAWIHLLEQLQGFQKIFDLNLLGTWISPHQLGIQYQTDYTPQWTDAVWLDATGLSSSAGWITGAGANTIGVERISGSSYGDGLYGAGEYGGTMPGIYEWRLDLYEPGVSIQFRFQDFEADGYTGASFELTEMVLTGGIIGNVRRPVTAGRSA